MGVKEKKSKQANSNQQQHQNGHFSPFKFAKLVDPDASWDKDQLGDVLHWIRQIVALLCGLIWGAIPLIGGIWFVIFLVISSAIIYGYYAMLLKVDEEDFGGHGALLQEGLFASITLFLLAWTLVYSLGHF
ncbi:Respirasome Complex Assembly Factor [Heracleum sosnowskyi]|uniref:Respirasome Complex Assembly Factor n=1 Tax=Heracleum sosnowskyi TaxID=360622 RepID=A0AAD8J3Y6_9APIA|nr:Respirasome Complex Assembly Factor [Heracleum sosnowskyi]